MAEIEEKPDMLVSPDGESVESVGAIDDSKVRELLAAGWRRVPLDQFIKETADKLGLQPE